MKHTSGGEVERNKSKNKCDIKFLLAISTQQSMLRAVMQFQFFPILKPLNLIVTRKYIISRLHGASSATAILHSFVPERVELT